MHKLSIALIICIACNCAYAKSPAEELSSILETYQTVQGEFVQTLVDSKANMLQESSGVFTVKAPGKFIWETTKPFPQKLIADLKTIWLYDPDLEQVTISSYDNNIEQSPAMLLSGNPEEILAHYTVKRSDLIADAYILKPIKKGGSFEELELLFNNAVIKTLILRDSLAQTTTFNVDNIQINEAVDDSIFIFNTPEGVDVLKNE